jgi:hypothetical protein
MIARTTNPKSKDWKNYGGRGIAPRERWLKFENFLMDMGEALPGMMLDRIDNDLGYFKENCRWVTAKESANNRRKATVPNETVGATAPNDAGLNG